MTSLKAHEYLRLKGFAFDLVMVNDRASSYRQEMQEALITDRRGRPRTGVGRSPRTASSSAARI